MHPLLGKTLLQVGLFYGYGLFVAWVFTFIEKRDESSHDRMERKLRELKNKVHLKYNMTDDDFGSFVKAASEAVIGHSELDWTFMNSCGFVFAALTTIGKVIQNFIVVKLILVSTYSRIPISRNLGFSNLPITRTSCRFPWICFQ